MAEIAELLPTASERVFICGKTGSGKTTLAEQILRHFQYVIAFDAKGRLGFDKQGRRTSWLEYKRVRTLSELEKAANAKNFDGSFKFPKIIYAPDVKEWRDERTVNKFFQFVFTRGNTALYVDEAYLITHGDDMPFWYHACYAQGRELGIITITSTQRPKRIPQILMSESEKAFIFRLRRPQDRTAIKEGFALEVSKQEQLGKHDFFYLTDEGAERGPLFLDFRRDTHANSIDNRAAATASSVSL